MDKLDKEKYELVEEKSLEDDIYTCDRCERVFDKESKNKQKKKWWEYRKISRKESGKIALIGLLGFIICQLLGAVVRDVGDILGAAGMISGIIWLVKTIQFKIKKKK